MPPHPLLHTALSKLNVLLFQLLRLLGKSVDQYDLISNLKEKEDTVLIGTMMYSQLPNLPSNDIRVGPFQVRPILFEQRQMRRNLRPGFAIQTVEEFINRRIASLCRVQDKVVQSTLQIAFLIYIILDVLSSSILQ